MSGGATAPSRLFEYVMPPRAGQLTSVAVSAVAGSLDMRQLGNQTVDTKQQITSTVGLPGRYVTFFADGADVYVTFGPTNASVTGANAPVAATNGINGVGVGSKIPSGQNRRWLLAVGTDLFIGFVASAAGQLRIEPSSP